MARLISMFSLLAPAAPQLFADPICGADCVDDVQCSKAASNCTWCIESTCSPQPTGCGGSAPTEAATALPQYYVIGDSVSHGYSVNGGLVTSLEQQGLFEVLPIDAGGGGQAGPSSRGVQCLPFWLGQNVSRFDVVSWNFGLHDIEKGAWDAQTHVPLADYRTNLQKIARMIQRRLPSAKQLYITTTPVPNSLLLSPPRNESDVVAYNKAAKEVMAGEGVAVLDLWAWIEARCGGDPYGECPSGCAEQPGGESANCVQRKDNVHFWPAGYRYAVEAISAAVESLHYGTACPDFLPDISSGICGAPAPSPAQPHYGAPPCLADEIEVKWPALGGGQACAPAGCGTDGDCPSAPAGIAAAPQCRSGGKCLLKCASTNQCPSGASCSEGVCMYDASVVV